MPSVLEYVSFFRGGRNENMSYLFLYTLCITRGGEVMANGLQGKERYVFVKLKQQEGYKYAQIAPLLDITEPSLRSWMSRNSKKYAQTEVPNVITKVERKVVSTRHQPQLVHNDDVDLDLPREVKLKMIQDYLFEMVLKGEVSKKEFLDISKELRYWREHEERYGAIEAEEKTVSLDLADLDYVLAHVEEVICPACPYRRRAIQDARSEQEKARLLPT